MKNKKSKKQKAKSKKQKTKSKKRKEIKIPSSGQGRRVPATSLRRVSAVPPWLSCHRSGDLSRITQLRCNGLARR
jgi:hypothetical protein